MMKLMTMPKTKRVFTLLLRVLALGSTFAAAVVMATSHEKANMFGVRFEAKYSHTPAFKYFLVANVVGSVYSFLVLFLPAESLLWRSVVALDVVMTMLLTSGVSAALAIAYVGKKGNSHAGWLPICGPVENYCHHVGGALASGFVAVLIYMILLLYSIQTGLNTLLV
ncbi:CASP-like protein [Actinidia chinensis var. chinensis]|uniref:CASP-like protein n=1 Tax=Actinidia chinensis var. chinensis TaxID=1590841 RepID=A0A2R6QKK0_ACTCC|nr:CASP-like protein [Actinidia chinensis var. chinensis]PSS09905.1 CASP-like protein [Actinidia chinensis var. chinensis]